MDLRRKRLMTLAHLFLIHRYKIESVHYLTPNDDNARQAERMKARGIYRDVTDEVGEIIVADVDRANVSALIESGLDTVMSLTPVRGEGVAADSTRSTGCRDLDSPRDFTHRLRVLGHRHRSMPLTASRQ